jgi:hypothetical protein
MGDVGVIGWWRGAAATASSFSSGALPFSLSARNGLFVVADVLLFEGCTLRLFDRRLETPRAAGFFLLASEGSAGVDGGCGVGCLVRIENGQMLIFLGKVASI